MPVITACPDCSRQLRVPDELRGKKVRCPSCKVIFMAEGPADNAASGAAEAAPRRAAPRDDFIEQPPPRGLPPPRQEPDYDRREARDEFDADEQPRGRRLHEDDEYGNENVRGPVGDRAAWHRVALGLVLILISIAVSIIIPFVTAGGGAVIGAMAASNAGAPSGRPITNPMALSGARGSFLALTIFATLLHTANACLKCYGHYLGTSVPDKPGTGLKARALATFGLFSAWTALSTSAGVLDIATGVGNSLSANPLAAFGGGFGTIPMMIAAGFNLIGLLCYMSGFVAFVLYLRALALAARHRDLANALKIFLISVCSVSTVLFVMAAIAVAVLGFAFLSAGPGAGAGPAPGQVNAAVGGVLATGGLICLGLLAFVGLGIWYIILLIQVRFAVVEYARYG
jgi:predicted Zn finger-like uncharacterized protein